MRKILSLFAVALLSFGLVTVSTDADAKRFGGGSSFGKQRQTTSRQAEPAKPAQAPAAAPAPAAIAGSAPWPASPPAACWPPCSWATASTASTSWIF